MPIVRSYFGVHQWMPNRRATIGELSRTGAQNRSPVIAGICDVYRVAQASRGDTRGQAREPCRGSSSRLRIALVRFTPNVAPPVSSPKLVLGLRLRRRDRYVGSLPQASGLPRCIWRRNDDAWRPGATAAWKRGAETPTWPRDMHGGEVLIRH